MAFHPDAMRAMVDFAWPGNVRELQHVIERAVILTQGSLIGVDDLPDKSRRSRRPPISAICHYNGYGLCRFAIRAR